MHKDDGTGDGGRVVMMQNDVGDDSNHDDDGSG